MMDDNIGYRINQNKLIEIPLDLISMIGIPEPKLIWKGTKIHLG